MAVDKIKWTCTVLGEGGDKPALSDIPINPIMIGKEGSGMYYLPDIGSSVWVAELPVSGSFVLMGAVMPFDGTGEDEAESMDMDASQYRTSIEPGDMVMTGKPGSQVVVRKNGVIEIGSTYLSKRFYLPLDHFIRDFTKQYELITSGGGLSYKTDEMTTFWGSITKDIVVDPATATTETATIHRTPTKFELSVKEFAQDRDPLFELQVGRVDLDSKDKLVGGESWRDIVFEMLLHNPEPSLEDQDGTKKGGSVRIYMDKKGTINSAFFGSRFTKVHETDTVIAANYTRKVSGASIVESSVKSETVYTSSKYFVGGPSIVDYGSTVDITGKGQVSANIEAPLNLTCGERNEKVNGSYNITALGEMTTTTARDYKVAVGGKSIITSGGPAEIVASNKVGAESTGLLLKSLGGKVQITSEPGNGPIPYGTGIEIKTGGGTIICDDTGNIYIRNSSSNSTIQVNSGGIGISTPGGEITISTSGEVSLGGPLNSAGVGCGKVVTTLTHPFCFVTGLPIRGSDTVSAFSKNPIGAPGPKVPSTPYINIMAAAEAAIAAANTN